MKSLIAGLTTRGDRGVTMIEYALLVSLIAVVSVSAVAMVGHHTEDTFHNMTVALGGEAPEDEASAPGDDDQGSGQPGDPDDPGAPDEGGTNDEPGPEPDQGGTTDEPAPDPDEGGSTDDTTDQGSNVEILDTSAELTAWRSNQGAWSALVTFANEWDHDQELTVEVTQVDGESGAQPATTVTVKVAAGAKSTLVLEDLQLTRKGKNFNGIVSVEIRVVSVATQDAKGQPVTYTPDHGPNTTVEHPTP